MGQFYSGPLFNPPPPTLFLSNVVSLLERDLSIHPPLFVSLSLYVVIFGSWGHWGPLHTRAKIRDQEIVGAQKKVSKGRPNPPPTSSCRVVTGPQPNAISMDLYSCGFSHMIEIEQIDGCECSERHGLLVLCQAYFQRMDFENNPSNLEIWFIWSRVGIHMDFTLILHSHTQLVPRASCEANLDRLHLFHQWECLKCNGHGLSVSCAKWPWVFEISCPNSYLFYIHVHL